MQTATDLLVPTSSRKLGHTRSLFSLIFLFLSLSHHSRFLSFSHSRFLSFSNQPHFLFRNQSEGAITNSPKQSKSEVFLKRDGGEGDRGNGGHRFQLSTFKKPSWCKFCGSFLWGITNQVLQLTLIVLFFCFFDQVGEKKNDTPQQTTNIHEKNRDTNVGNAKTLHVEPVVLIMRLSPPVFLKKTTFFLQKICLSEEKREKSFFLKPKFFFHENKLKFSPQFSQSSNLVRSFLFDKKEAEEVDLINTFPPADPSSVSSSSSLSSWFFGRRVQPLPLPPSL